MKENGPCNLVTGALGFVGLYLVDTLLRAGIPVVGLGRIEVNQDLPAQAGAFQRAAADPALADAVRYEGASGSWNFVPCALEDAHPIAKLVDQLRPTAVYHLAAQSSAAYSFRDPHDTFASNLTGTLNLLEAARAVPDSQRPVILAVGSGEEYGRRDGQDENSEPFTEESALAPVSPYAVSKVAQSLLCQQYARSYDLPVIIARAFGHTGPGQDTRFALPSFAAQIAAAEAGQRPAQIAVGDLSPVRDYCDVRDVVAAYRLLVNEGVPGEIYNVCSGQPLTIRGGLEILLQAAAIPIEIRTDPERLRPADLPYLVGDNGKLRSATGWEAEHSIEQTLEAILDHARAKVGASTATRAGTRNGTCSKDGDRKDVT